MREVKSTPIRAGEEAFKSIKVSVTTSVSREVTKRVEVMDTRYTSSSNTREVVWIAATRGCCVFMVCQSIIQEVSGCPSKYRPLKNLRVIARLTGTLQIMASSTFVTFVQHHFAHLFFWGWPSLRMMLTAYEAAARLNVMNVRTEFHPRASIAIPLSQLFADSIRSVAA